MSPLRSGRIGGGQASGARLYPISVLANLLRRLSRFAFLYLLASVAIFAAIDAIPGDPIALRFGKTVDPERVALERARLGLDAPWAVRYAASQARFWSGDWGVSLSTGRATMQDVRSFLPATVELTLLALLIGAPAGAAAALAGALGGRPWLGALARGLGTIGLVAPIYWIGIALLLVGSVWLGWFPLGGRYDLLAGAGAGPTGFALVDAALAGDGARLLDALRHLALPAVCLAFYPAANVAAALGPRLREPDARGLVAGLRARGYGPGRIVWRHLLRVAAPLGATVLGTTFGGLIGGAVLTETVFSWPGMGRYLVSAVLGRDVFAAQNALLLVALAIVAVAAGSDLAAWRLDPRSRDKGGEAE